MSAKENTTTPPVAPEVQAALVADEQLAQFQNPSPAENSSYQIVPTVDEAYQPSEYELQRLERIRRNQEYLASLGLEPLQAATANKKRRKSAEIERPPVEKRPRSSRLQGKEFNFNVDDLLNIKKMTTIKDDKLQEDTAPLEQETKTIKVKDDRKADNPSNDSLPTEKKIRYREFVFNERRRMQTERRLNLRIGERNMRAAEKELRIAEREYDWVSKRKTREEELRKRRILLEEYRINFFVSQELRKFQEERKNLQKVGI